MVGVFRAGNFHPVEGQLTSCWKSSWRKTSFLEVCSPPAPQVGSTCVTDRTCKETQAQRPTGDSPRAGCGGRGGGVREGLAGGRPL